MRISDELAAQIGIALNEATFLGAEYAPNRNMVGLTFSVLTLPDDHSPQPEDPRRQFILTDVGRIAAALRDANWNDTDAKTVPFAVEDLLSVVKSFGGLPIYGWKFVNNEDSSYSVWKDQLSVDVRAEGGSLENRLSLFQEAVGINRHLDLWIWFDEMVIRDAVGNTISMTEFVEGGKRWWDALYAEDSRTMGHGIVPCKPQ